MRFNDPASHRDAHPLEGWTVDRTGLVLTVWWNTPDRSHGMLRLFTAEAPDEIHVLALDNESLPDPDDDSGWGLMGGPTLLIANLARPIGQRRVIDAATGNPLAHRQPPSDSPYT